MKAFVRWPLLTMLCLAIPVSAKTSSPRQYYSSWHKHPTHGYHFRQFYFKPHADFSGYKHHFVINFPSRPKHHYFYNPETKTYWGRCPAQTNGKPQYSLLAEKDRKGKVSDIPESAFPEPGELPPIPESKDGERIDLPPNDLPNDIGPPKE